MLLCSAEPPLRHRARLQYSLRTLLLLLTLFCIVGGWTGSRARREIRYRATVESILASHGSVGRVEDNRATEDEFRRIHVVRGAFVCPAVVPPSALGYAELPKGNPLVRILVGSDPLSLPTGVFLGPAWPKDDLSAINELKDLRELTLVGRALTRREWEFISEVARLRHLKLEGRFDTPNFGDEQLAGAGSLATLEDLELVNTAMTDEGLICLRDLPNLKSLCLHNAGRITDAGLAHVAALAKLETFRFCCAAENYPPQANVSDDGIAHLAGARRLRVLDLTATGITRKGLASIAKLESLKELHLPFTRITDDDLTELAAMEELRALNLTFTGITDKGVANIVKLPRMERLDLSFTGITDAGVAELSALPELRLVGLHHAIRVTDRGVESLVHLERLEALDLSETKITDRALVALAQAPCLRELYLADSGITDQGIAHLAGLRGLERLALDCEPITDASVAHLEKLRKLKLVWLRGTHMTEKGIDELKRSLPYARIYH